MAPPSGRSSLLVVAALIPVILGLLWASSGSAPKSTAPARAESVAEQQRERCGELWRQFEPSVRSVVAPIMDHDPMHLPSRPCWSGASKTVGTLERILAQCWPGLSPHLAKCKGEWRSNVVFEQLLNVSKTAQALETSQAPDAWDKRDVKTVVVGGGPVGLASAIMAALQGSSVTVFEKRTTYTRDIWFDLDVHTTVRRLHEWGASYLAMNFTHHTETDQVQSTQCAAFERLLAVIAWMSGVQLRFGTSVEDVSKTRASITVIEATGRELDVPFGLLIVTDGARSGTRTKLGVDFHPQTRAPIMSQLAQDQLGSNAQCFAQLDVLRQGAIIVQLQPNATGHCPPEKRDAYGDIVNPFQVSFHLPAVTSVFKRFFPNHCELQVLVSDAAATVMNLRVPDSTVAANTAWSSFPWSLVHDVTQHVLQTPPDNVDTLMTWVVPQSAQAFDVVIGEVRQPFMSLGSSAILFRGDAAMSVHFRLGIGVNHAFRSLEDVAVVLQLVADARLDAETVSAVSEEIAGFQQAAVQYQSHAMFHEAYCGAIVHDGEVFVRDLPTGRFVDVAPWDLLKDVKACKYCQKWCQQVSCSSE